MITFDLIPVLMLDRMGAADLGDWLRFVGRLHPFFVHFPLAFVVLAAGLELVHAVTRRPGVAPGVRRLLVAAAIGAAAAGTSGWMNAHHEWADLDQVWRDAGRPAAPKAEDAAHLGLHRLVSIVASVTVLATAAGAVAIGSAGAGLGRTITRGGLVIALAATLWTGHLGGELVHGRGYVLDAFPPPPPAAPAPPAPPAPPAGGDAPAEDAAPAPLAETDAGPRDGGDVAPVAGDADLAALESRALAILDTHCTACHGPVEQKAGLQLVPLPRAFEWEPEFWTIRPGRPDESTVIERIELPVGDPRRMPPDGPGLTPEELGTLRAWIAAGAPVDGRPVAGE